MTQVQNVSDVLDATTNQPFSHSDWEDFIKDTHMEHLEEVPDDDFVNEQAEKAVAIVRQIPREVLEAAKKLDSAGITGAPVPVCGCVARVRAQLAWRAVVK